MGLFDDDIIEDIKKYREYKDYLKEECKRYVQDDTKDLDRRWDFFIDHAVGKGSDTYYWHVNNDPEADRWIRDRLSDGWYEKYQVIDIPSFIERAPKAMYDRLREAAMKDYIISFEYDW